MIITSHLSLSPELADYLKMKNNMDNHVMCRIKIKRRILGNVLRGKVQIVTQDMLVIQHAYIEITGLASCSWQLPSAYIRFPKLYGEDTIVKGFQQFYYTRHSLCGGEISHQHRGYESYKFKCYWPSRLPGTWVGDFGTVEYVGKVTIKLENKDVYTHSQIIFVKFQRHLCTEEHLLFEGRMDVTRNFYTTKSIVQGAFKRYRSFGYPNIDTPGIPIIIGTTPLKTYNTYEITSEVFKKMQEYNVPILFDELPEDFKQIIHKTEEELSRDAVENLERQLQFNEQMVSDLTEMHSQRIVGDTED